MLLFNPDTHVPFPFFFFSFLESCSVRSLDRAKGIGIRSRKRRQMYDLDIESDIAKTNVRNGGDDQLTKSGSRSERVPGWSLKPQAQ